MPKVEPSQHAILAALLKHARPVMLTAVNPDSCIAMTRCAMEVLEVFGLEVEPINVETFVANAKFIELLEAERIRMDEKLPDWAVDEGAWAIGVGVKPKPHEAGHVVAKLDDLLIDLSIDQATRRLKDIMLQPLVVQVPEGELMTHVVTPTNVYVSYQLHPEWQTWKDSPDWRRFSQRYWNQTALIIRRMKKELGL